MRIPLLLLFVISAHVLKSQCTAAFQFSGNYDTLSFVNLSQVNDAHYYWNFGDGQTSTDMSPVHRFPGSGHYLVGLYILDTVTGCHDVAQVWIDVTRPSADGCIASFTDSIINFQGQDYIEVENTSQNCGQYDSNIDCGPALNMPPGNWIGVYGGWGSALFMGRIKLFVNDTA